MALAADSLRELGTLYEQATHELDGKSWKPFLLNQANRLQFEEWPRSKRPTRMDKAVSRYVEQTRHYLEGLLGLPASPKVTDIHLVSSGDRNVRQASGAQRVSRRAGAPNEFQ